MSHADQKDLPVHEEGMPYDDDQKLDHIVDTEAAGYLDPTVVITPEENKRLLRKIYIQ